MIATLSLYRRFRRTRAPTLVGGGIPFPAPAPEELAVEPSEGWDARWDAKRPVAIATCRGDVEVTTWPQMVTCALTVAFPEAGPWTDPSMWAGWQQEAATAVEDDLRGQVGEAFSTTEPTAWQLSLWLMADRYAGQCNNQGVAPEAMVDCIAKAIYSEYTWPPPVVMEGPLVESPTAGWVEEFYQALSDFVAAWTPPVVAGVDTGPGVVEGGGAVVGGFTLAGD